MTHEREITLPVDLCRADGRLDPGAVGFSRRPLHRANLRGWGRTKRWEYWGIVTPTHVVGVVLSSLDYAGVNSIYVLERGTGREWTEEAVVPFARGVALPETSGAGVAEATRGAVRIRIDQQAAGTTIVARAGGMVLDVAVPAGGESLGVVVPWSRRRFQYTLKDVTRAVTGSLVLDGEVHPIGQESFAVLDHGRGKWPYAMTWNWAAGCSEDRRIGLQLGGKWTDRTGSTENGLFVDGRLHKIGAELSWRYDREDWLQPWRIDGDRVAVSFEPFHERVATTSLGVVASETHQCFGHFSGTVVDDAGRAVSVDGLVGWAEEAHNRW